MTKWSPETRRRRAPRRGVRARVGKPLGGARERKDRGGGGEAHGEAVGGRQRARGGSRRRNGAAIDGGRAGKTSSGRPLQWLGAPTERWRWCSRGRRRRTTRRSGDWGTVAAGTTVNGGDRVGRGEGRSGADLGGRERRRGREESGASGREARGGGGAGDLILPVAGEGVRRGLPLFRPRSGEQGRGRAGEVGWAGGRRSRARGPVG